MFFDKSVLKDLPDMEHMSKSTSASNNVDNRGFVMKIPIKNPNPFG